jgi:hypothetical protein
MESKRLTITGCEAGRPHRQDRCTFLRHKVCCCSCRSNEKKNPLQLGIQDESKRSFEGKDDKHPEHL